MNRKSKPVLAIFLRSLHEYCSHKLFAVLVLITLLLIYFSILVGVMAVDYEKRVLLDFGSGFIEIMAFAYLLYVSAFTIFEEAESKTIHLVFSRPVAGWQYLLGKFLSLYALAAVLILYSGVFHLVLIFSRGHAFPGGYFEMLFLMWCKVSLASTVTIFISLFSTSPLTPMIVSLILWMGGHLVPEIKFLIERSTGFSAFALKASSWVLPNFQIFNMRDWMDSPAARLAFRQPAYLLAWISALFAASVLVVRKKEF